ncbi:type II toxin-antitoxin system VapC family toxin [Halovivax sp.]|uniref:type II toxin-antitoxin system VapC family toxin n=1 Tax=Halovivax sp. TaxID=1935978 RepID=UPI0025C4091D|nr:PIN domain-containing protein [Halovivax sp.]
MPSSRFEPETDGPTPLFLDTSGLFAYFHPRADEHERTREFFQDVLMGSTPYRPLYTHTYVVDELVTLLQSKATPSLAREAFERIVRSDAIELLYETESRFDAVGEGLTTYDDHEISFTDHMIAVTMRERNVDHVLAYDGDFATLGMTAIPR